MQKGLYFYIGTDPHTPQPGGALYSGHRDITRGWLLSLSSVSGKLGHLNRMPHAGRRRLTLLIRNHRIQTGVSSALSWSSLGLASRTIAYRFTPYSPGVTSRGVFVARKEEVQRPMSDGQGKQQTKQFKYVTQAHVFPSQDVIVQFDWDSVVAAPTSARLCCPAYFPCLLSRVPRKWAHIWTSSCVCRLLQECRLYDSSVKR